MREQGGVWAFGVVLLLVDAWPVEEGTSSEAWPEQKSVWEYCAALHTEIWAMTQGPAIPARSVTGHRTRTPVRTAATRL